MERQWTGNARRLSQTDRAEIERRIRSGETFEMAAAAVGCSTKSIQRFLAVTGGLKSRLKQRSAIRLSLAEREELSRGLVAGDSLREIARRLGRAPSTISREVAWNGSRGRYRAWRADREAIARGRRPKPAKLALDSRLCREVERGLRVNWSPQQISAQLIRDYPDDVAMRVSHETIYRTLFVQARGALRKELTTCLRTGGAQRRPHMRVEQSGAGRLRNMILISDRPPEVEDRAVPGHLGRRPHNRKGHSLSDRGAGGASEPLRRPSAPSARAACRGCPCRPDAPGLQAASRAPSDVDVGSREGDG